MKKRSRTRSSLCSVVAIATMVALALGIAGCSNASKPAASSSGSISAAEQQAEKREYEVSIDGVREGTDYAGNPVVIVAYSWTNNSDKTTSFAAALYPKVFQNGVQCDTGITTDIDSNGYMSDVKPGYGTTFEFAYKVSDSSDVTIEIGPLVNLKDEVWLESTYSFEE